jgi:hypothetical protein
MRGALALLAAGLVIGAGVPSLAGASADSSDFKLSYQKLPDGRNVVARWNPCQVVTYRVNPTYLSANSAARSRGVSEVKEAFRRASLATGITFKYAGLSAQIPRNTSSSRWHQRQNSAEIVVAWVNQTKSASRSNLLGRSGSGYSAGTGGYAFKYWKVGSAPWAGVTGRGFVVLDARQNGKFTPGFGRGATRGSLILHEIGHSLGLMHVGVRSQTMYPSVVSRSTTGYSSGDLAGLRRVGRSAGCTAVSPSWVWTDQK